MLAPLLPFGCGKGSGIEQLMVMKETESISQSSPVRTFISPPPFPHSKSTFLLSGKNNQVDSIIVDQVYKVPWDDHFPFVFLFLYITSRWRRKTPPKLFTTAVWRRRRPLVNGAARANLNNRMARAPLVSSRWYIFQFLLRTGTDRSVMLPQKIIIKPNRGGGCQDFLFFFLPE